VDRGDRARTRDLRFSRPPLLVVYNRCAGSSRSASRSRSLSWETAAQQAIGPGVPMSCKGCRRQSRSSRGEPPEPHPGEGHDRPDLRAVAHSHGLGGERRTASSPRPSAAAPDDTGRFGDCHGSTVRVRQRASCLGLGSSAGRAAPRPAGAQFGARLEIGRLRYRMTEACSCRPCRRIKWPRHRQLGHLD
jgi:hypothetical protein